MAGTATTLRLAREAPGSPRAVRGDALLAPFQPHRDRSPLSLAAAAKPPTEGSRDVVRALVESNRIPGAERIAVQLPRRRAIHRPAAVSEPSPPAVLDKARLGGECRPARGRAARRLRRGRHREQ